MNKEATPKSTYLIVFWSDESGFNGVTFCHTANVSLAPALVYFCPRRGWEDSTEIVGLLRHSPAITVTYL